MRVKVELRYFNEILQCSLLCFCSTACWDVILLLLLVPVAIPEQGHSEVKVLLPQMCFWWRNWGGKHQMSVKSRANATICVPGSGGATLLAARPWIQLRWSGLWKARDASRAGFNEVGSGPLSVKNHGQNKLRFVRRDYPSTRCLLLAAWVAMSCVVARGWWGALQSLPAGCQQGTAAPEWRSWM